MNKFPNKATQFSSENQPEKRGRPMLIKIAFSQDSHNNEKLRAIKEILDRIEGLPDQNVNVSATPPSWINTDEDETSETIL